jgi:transcriptional regulator with XRE-family HTH domain
MGYSDDLSGYWQVAVVAGTRLLRQSASVDRGSHMLVQKLRLQRGWSQEQLAELSGLSVRTIQRIERGQPASVETLKALGAVFEIDFSAFKEPDMNTTPNHTVSADEALALAHVRKLKGFYIHLAEFAVFIVLLAIMNLILTPHRLWVIWVALAWGVGLAFHALSVFDKVPFLSGEWERRQVERFLGRKL